ncbi:MAG: hypothetical protein IKX97_02240 [Erysipelotrichaceae bacterium]|nr:hypothetical protein [Erysipelotrichaceae bacterium]MBR5754627.1 hypothetical protein [Erysipelotrichaceae bacterium]
MRRRRGPFSGLFTLFMIIMMFDVFGFALDLLDVFAPIIAMGLIGYGFAKLFQSLFRPNVRTTYNNNRRQTQTVYNAYNQSNVKSAKIRSIDKILADYYKNNVSLVLFDDVSISTQNGVYSTVDNLYVNYKDEKICQLKELKEVYPGAYDKVIEALSKVSKKDIKAMNEAGRKKEESKKKEETKKEESKDSFSDAGKFIDQINSLNQGLSNEEVTNGLYQTCDLLKQIDIVDREDGTVDPKLNKLYEYYLPILTGILEDYKKLADSPVKGDDYKKCETQLVKTVKLINEALKIIYNSLHEADYMNLNADINTLQSLLKQDGYGNTPFREDQ